MEISSAASIFATLGHPGRLAVFRLLMRFAPRGVRPTEIAAALAMKPNTLSNHLAELSAVGLIGVTRRGRSLHYAVDLDRAEALLGYLALDIGRGRPDLIAPLLSGSGCDRGRKSFNALFICTGNSARSIFAEALLRDLGAGRFRVFSAGTRPGSAINPLSLQVLAQNGHDTAALRSKHVSQFQSPDAPAMDFVFTVCDSAAAEDCPPWPGQPITGHWGLPDPARAMGTDAEKALAFRQTYAALRRRISAFAELPLASLDRLALQSRVDAIDAAAQADDLATPEKG